MSKSETEKIMNAEQKIDWLNERDPLNEWAVDDDVFCLHCDGVFKAQDLALASDGCPTCPVCHTNTPLYFHAVPWWREDLVAESETEDDIERNWIGKPIGAVAGQPGKLPRPAGSHPKLETVVLRKLVRCVVNESDREALTDAEQRLYSAIHLAVMAYEDEVRLGIPALERRCMICGAPVSQCCC
jgi:hypothetical protein